MPQKMISHLLFSIDRMHIEQVTEFNFLGLILDSNLNWKAHLSAISTKTSSVIGLNVGGAIHYICYINSLTATKVDSTYLGCLTSNTQRICVWQDSNA